MELLPKPNLKLTFCGLFLHCFGEGNIRGEIGVVKVKDHCLKITVKHDALGGRPIIHAVLPAELLTENISFEILNRPEGVEIFYGQLPFPRRSEQDFRWIVDLEGDEFHGGKLQIKPDATFQKIVVHQGHFHTAEKHAVRIKPPGSSSAAFPAAITEVVGCNIVLANGEKAVLKYGSGSGQQIEFPFREDLSYLIEIENFCTPADGSIPEGDFIHLYDSLMVADNQKFDVLPAGTSQNPERPCDGGYMSKHKSLDDKTP